jgi:hypothetical protein
VSGVGCALQGRVHPGFRVPAWPDPTLQRADASGQLAGIRDGGAASNTWRVTAAALSLRVSFVVPLRDSATHPRAGPLRRAL